MSQTPPLAEVIEAGIADRLESFYTAIPARVLSWNASGNTVDIEMSIVNSVEDSRGEHTWLAPKVINVPVLYPGSGKNRTTYPIKPGDQVLYIVSSLPTKGWAATNQQQLIKVPEESRNSISYGFAIPGLFPNINVPQAASEDDVVMHAENKIKLGGPTSEEFVALKKDLQNLRSALISATIAVGAGGAASVVTACDTLAGGAGKWPEGSTKVQVK